FRSASLILSGGFGAIGIGPKLPLPPVRTFCINVATTSWPLYLAAISLKEGPTIFLSLAWQARQPALFIAASGLACAGAEAPSTATARPIANVSCVFMEVAPVSVDVVLGVVHVEVPRRRDQARILDHLLELQRLVVDDDQRALLVLGAPHREPDLVAGLVELRLHDAL